MSEVLTALVGTTLVVGLGILYVKYSIDGYVTTKGEVRQKLKKAEEDIEYFEYRLIKYRLDALENTKDDSLKDLIKYDENVLKNLKISRDTLKGLL